MSNSWKESSNIKKMYTINEYFNMMSPIWTKQQTSAPIKGSTGGYRDRQTIFRKIHLFYFFRFTGEIILGAPRLHRSSIWPSWFITGPQSTLNTDENDAYFTRCSAFLNTCACSFNLRANWSGTISSSTEIIQKILATNLEIHKTRKSHHTTFFFYYWSDYKIFRPFINTLKARAKH